MSGPLGISRMQFLVLMCVAGGMTFRQVGQSLHIAPATAHDYMERIAAHWGLKTQDRVALVREAERRGVLQ
jgi:DNA-binding NarL/FixJ family response regulator